MKIRSFVIIALISVQSLYAAPNLSVAVTPFANLSGVKTQDYLGFQIAEFVSGGLAGYPGVAVVERGAIDIIIQEQELQLSGLTSEKGAVQIGNIANAAQMIVGSFTVDAKGTMSLTGRLVDVATSSILGSTTVTGVLVPSPAPLYKDFVFKLLSSVKGYGMNVAVEGRLATLSEEDAGVSADYARALEASFRKNDEEARKYLERVVQGDRLATSSYVDASNRYQAVISRLEGESLYATLIKNQLMSNAELMTQVEPLTNYRNTLKALARKVDAYLTPDAVELRIDRKESIALGSVNAVVTLPSVTVRLRDEARAGIEGMFGEQDIVTLTDKGIASKKAPPAGKLLSSLALERLFDLAVFAEVGYRVVFRDKAGAEVWQLVAKPVGFLRIDGSAGSWSLSPPNSWNVPTQRDGWALRADGTVEIQARAIKDLAGVKVELVGQSFKKTASFASSGDIRWKSLILHAYRKNYTKLAVENDPCPAIKDLVIADSFIETKDPTLGRVPVVPEDDKRAAWARLTGVVYFGDETTTTVQVSWERQGSKPTDSAPYAGSLTQTSVLYFPGPNGMQPEGLLTVNAKIGSASSRSTRAVLANGKGWASGQINGQALLLNSDRVYATGGSSTCAFDLTTGKALWKSSRGGSAVFFDSGQLFVTREGQYANDGGTAALDPDTGSVLWDIDTNQRGSALFFGSGRLYKGSNRMPTVALDPGAGNELWSNNRYGSALLLDSGRLFLTGSGSAALDPATGKELWTSNRQGSALSLDSGRLFVTGSGTAALDPATGKEYWTSNRQGSALFLDSGRLFVTGAGTAAFDPATGKELWISTREGSAISLDSSRLYVTGGRAGKGSAGSGTTTALDLATGKELWTSSRIGSALLLESGLLIVTGVDGTAALDLSLINRD